jgi:proline iminopeptidase
MDTLMLPVNSAQLFTLEIGDGPTAAVLLHGGPGASHDYLRPGLDAIGEPGRLRLFYYDQRGSGRSTLTAGTPPGGWRDHVADLDAIRAHLGGAPLLLVGYSWGALLALLYTIEHPEHVARLALISPAPAAAGERPEAQERVLAMGPRPAVQALRARLDAPEISEAERRRHRFTLAVAGYFADPERALGLTPFIVKQSAEQAAWRSLGDNYDLRPQLERLRVPAWVAHGCDDPIPIATAHATAAALGAPCLALAHCGHVPYVEAPERLLPPLRAFLLD